MQSKLRLRPYMTGPPLVSSLLPRARLIGPRRIDRTGSFRRRHLGAVPEVRLRLTGSAPQSAWDGICRYATMNLNG